MKRWWFAYPILWFIVWWAYREYHSDRMTDLKPKDWAYITSITVGLLYVDGEYL